jgi:integrase/recombinase XerD
MQFKEETMLVHPVVTPGSGTRSWTVLGDDDVPVVPVDRFLAYLTDIGRSPNTVKVYSHDLKDYWEFLGFRGLDWRETRLEDVGEFVAWLRLPPAGRSGEVAVLPSATAHTGASTVNRKLAAVSAFYAHQARNGVGVEDLLAAWRTGSRGGWKPFLHHVSKGKPYRGRAIALKAPKKLPRILTPAEMQAVLDACTRLRDRFFFAVLHESGCRAGEALGLRHEDIAAAECEISIVARENANGARAKSGGRTVPVGPDLIRLYADYLHEEYGSALSDYVFINLWAEPKGQAWSYQAAYDLVLRLRARTGIEFDPHWFRHSAATRWQGRGVASDATFRRRREDGAVRDGAPGTAGRRSRRQSEPTGQDGRDRTVLRQMLRWCVHSGCIRCKHDAVKATKKRSDEGGCQYRPVVTLTHSAGLVIRSLPVA